MKTTTHRARAGHPPIKRWAATIKQHPLHALVRKPHHYSVAMGLTVISGAVHFDLFVVVTFWGYAVLENLFTSDR